MKEEVRERKEMFVLDNSKDVTEEEIMIGCDDREREVMETSLPLNVPDSITSNEYVRVTSFGDPKETEES